ncbi:hypothetical protein BFJ72_g9689 [Fusarium proliferatum]|uniref:Levodione reductase n=1 Tax=Gibberella intermedia TaxID=948311 RepID=A0A420SX89_GIBIN|nr:hypothetical protein BFJ72_g9689 [Fusarium proliferatum]
MLNISLQGQVGIVTGAGSAYGIGRSMVIAAAQAGAAAVYACDLNLSYMDDLKKEVKDMGHDTIIEGHFLDVSNEDQTVALLREILRNHGRVDFFFANAGPPTNAGYESARPLQDLTVDHFNRAVDVMQRGCFLALKYGSQAMSVTSPDKTEAKGNIIITSSCAAFAGAYADTSYTAVKNACNGLVESGSVQLSASNIRVNGIAPGCTNSSILTSSTLSEKGDQYTTSATKEEIAATHAKFFERGGLYKQKEKFYNRAADPSEIANLACFLASDLALAINGQIILADSGKTTAATGEGFTGAVNPVPALSMS